MRKVINIVGVGSRRAGTSEKTGRNYDFTPISFTYEDEHTQGVKAETVNVDSGSLAGYTPVVGDVVEVVMHYANYRTFIDAVLN